MVGSIGHGPPKPGRADVPELTWVQPEPGRYRLAELSNRFASAEDPDGLQLLICDRLGPGDIQVFFDGREFGDVGYALCKDEWEQQNGITAG
jgi:hypothetical protein